MVKKKIIETILLASHQTISNDDIRKVLNQDLNSDEIISIINELNIEYKEFNKGIYIDFISNGYQIRTIPELHKYIQIIRDKDSNYKLTRPAFEVLSIIAFKQPVSKSEIEAIRGVDCSGVIKTLLKNDLIIIKGRAKEGRFLLYGTSNLFLDAFGLNNILDLPSIKEIKEIVTEDET